jgi:hydroxymethylbilane synthase
MSAAIGSKPVLRIGSRGSKLALWQAEWVKAQLAGAGFAAEIQIIRTTGDKILDVPLARIGGKGVFTKEIEQALLDNEIDLAVHSLKDLPTTLPEGLALAAMPQREDVRDALVGSTLDALPEGARVGTGSLRRAAQLRAIRPDVRVTDIRGNVDTRLRKLHEGGYDALVMASAGLTRLGLQDEIGEYLDPLRFLPAVGQGALAIETRNEPESFVWRVCRSLHDEEAAATVNAERALLQSLGGGCQVPLGAFATRQGNRLLLHAVIVSPDGGQVFREQLEGDVADATQLGADLAAALLASPAGKVIEELAAFQAPELESAAKEQAS